MACTAALLVSVSAGSLRAQAAEFTRLLDSTLRASKLPAMAVAIVTRDAVLYHNALGVRRRGDPTPVTPDDRFHIGSNTKAMTAGLVGLLVDEGRMRWTTTIAELFPELATRMRPEYRTVTVRELLTHHSGLVRDAAGSFGPGSPREQRTRAVEWILTRPPASPRGTLAYSNCNYILAGAMVERLTGEPYEQLLVRRLLAPLGLTTVGFGPPATPGKVDQPWGHVNGLFNRVKAIAPDDEHADNPPVYAPAGRIHLSVHDGSNDVFYSLAVLAPEAGFGVIVMTNQGQHEASEAIAGLANRLIRLYTNGPK